MNIWLTLNYEVTKISLFAFLQGFNVLSDVRVDSNQHIILNIQPNQ
jgi:hypothetical protein